MNIVLFPKCQVYHAMPSDDSVIDGDTMTMEPRTPKIDHFSVLAAIFRSYLARMGTFEWSPSVGPRSRIGICMVFDNEVYVIELISCLVVWVVGGCVGF